MPPYEYENSEGTLVTDIESGISGIGEHSRYWHDYIKWLGEGNTTIPYRTIEQKIREQLKPKIEKMVQERIFERVKINDVWYNVSIQERLLLTMYHSQALALMARGGKHTDIVVGARIDGRKVTVGNILNLVDKVLESDEMVFIKAESLIAKIDSDPLPGAVELKIER